METLKNLIEKDVLYEFYCDGEGGRSFGVGYVLAYNDDWALVECIARSGASDGYVLIEVASIVKLQYGTAYLKKLVDLSAAKGAQRKPLDFPETGLLSAVLAFIQTNRFVCTVDLIGESRYSESGYIEEVGVDSFRLAVLDSYGKADGFMIADIDDISSVTFNSGEELNLAILNLFDKNI